MPAQSPSSDRDPGEPLLSIGETAEVTGLSVATIRIWERRYGKPAPARLPSGHRRYRPADVRWLRRAAEALARGHRPSAIAALEEQALDALLAPEIADEASSQRLEEMMHMVRAYDGHGLREALLADWQELEPLAWCQRRMTPLIQRIGRDWVDGRLETRKEHFATEVCEDVLRLLRGHVLPPARPRPDAVLATLSGEMHDLGLQMVALILACNGNDARLLGRDLPVEEIAAAATETGAPDIAISVSLATGGVATDAALRSLRRLAGAEARIAVGGTGARGIRRGLADITYLDGLERLGGWLEPAPRPSDTPEDHATSAAASGAGPRPA